MLRKTRTAVALSAAGVSVALLVGGMQPAFATTAQGAPNSPQADVVGVGSDTTQFGADFLADGSPTDAGYNGAGNKYRLVNYDATGDAVGRALYNDKGAPNGQFYTDSPTTAVVLRAGQKPVEDPDGSTNGIAALLNDSPASGTNYAGTGTNGSIQYARSSRLPKSGEITTCTNNSTGCGHLDVYKLGTDALQIAHATAGTHAVALSGAQLVHIYQCDANYTNWNSSGIGGSSSEAIVPVIPQTGSGTRNDFLADLQNNFNGGTAIALGSCVVTAQEHDPAGITTQGAAGIDAIEPFSAARVALIDSGYFANAGVAAHQVTLQTTGSPLGGGVVYTLSRGMYFVVRSVDANNATVWQPGSTKNWVNTLFATGSYLAHSTGQSDVIDAGFVGGYVNCGQDPTTC